MTSGAAVKRMIGDDPEGKRQRHVEDFYRTGEVATRALLAVESFFGPIWEPACGAGDMSRVLEARRGGDRVISSDLHDRGYGDAGIDFLRAAVLPLGARHVVTNPPYQLIDEFVLKAIELDPPGKIAMIARLQWLEGQRRKVRIFDRFPPARVWVFPYRIPMTRGDLAMPRIGLVAFAWYVWERGHRGLPALGWPPKV